MHSRLHSLVVTFSVLLLLVLGFCVLEGWQTETVSDRRSQALCEAQNMTDAGIRECMIRLAMPANRRDEAIATTRTADLDNGL
jgi:hypothetical protein